MTRARRTLEITDLTCVVDQRFPVTRCGRVFSRARTTVGERWQEMSRFQRKREAKYLSVPLGWGNVYFVHRLVLETFVGPMPEGQLCRHLDGNPENNLLENLCYGTPQENSDDRSRHKAIKEARCLAAKAP